MDNKKVYQQLGSFVYQQDARKAVRLILEKEIKEAIVEEKQAGLFGIVDSVIDKLAGGLPVGVDLHREDWLKYAFQLRGARIDNDFKVEFKRELEKQMQQPSAEVSQVRLANSQAELPAKSVGKNII